MALPSITDAQKAKAHLNQIDLLVRSGRFQEAMDAFNGTLANLPSIKAPMMLLKGQILLGLKDYNGAAAMFESTVKEFPETPSAAQAACDMGQVGDAQGQNEQAAGIFMECFNKTTEEPQRSQALYDAFLNYEKAGLTDKAVETGESYLKTYPQGDHRFDVTIVLAGLYSKAKQYQKSVDLLKPLEDDPDDARRENATFQLAYNLQSAGETDEALVGYQKIITEHKTPDPVYYLALKNSFIIYLQKKDEAKAADVLERSIREFENNDIPLKDYLWLAQYWEDKNDPRAMQVILDAGEKLHGSEPAALGLKFFRAESDRLANNNADAVKLYDEVIAAPDNAAYKGRARLGKAVSLAANNDFAGADAELNQAITENPEDAFVAMRARFELAKNLEQAKKIEEAAKAYLIVAVLYKDPYFAPESLLHAGTLFQQLNNKTAAMDAYQQILKVYPKSPQASKAKEQADQIK
jgi:TolA-binding protein